MLAKKTSKNQLTLPKEIVKEFPDTDYFDVTVKERKIILMPVKITHADMTLEGIREKLKKLGITEGDVTEAVKWARKKSTIKKVVLDTNILVSALLFKGELAGIVDLWKNGKIVPVLSKRNFCGI